MRDPTKNSDEKHSFEEVVTPTVPTLALSWITFAANLTRRLSKKFLAWGVEERGAYRIRPLNWSILI
jgi:hypothetical protein